jgi:hypothetical protein
MSLWILLRLGNVVQKKCKEIETHVLFSVNIFGKSCLLYDNIKKHKIIFFCISKWLRERATELRYTNAACLVLM